MNKKGFILNFVLIFMAILVVAATSFIILTNNEIRAVRQQTDSLKAFFLAEAGIEKCLFKLTKKENYTGEKDVALGEGVYDVNVTSLIGKKQIDATGYIPDKTSPRAYRKVRVIAKRRTSAVTADSAVTGLTKGKEIIVTGNSTIDGKAGPGIKVPDLDMVSIAGSGEVKGDPNVLEKEPLPSFNDVFGMTKEEMKTLATVYTDTKPKNNIPSPANGITWIEGDRQYTQTGWYGEGILIVTGNLRLTGGVFNGVIYIMGDADLSAGNVDVNGAMIMQSDAKFAGFSSVEHDSTAIANISNYYPYEISSWEELP